MRKITDIQYRTTPNYRHLVVGAILSLSLAGCGWDSEIRNAGLTPSSYADAQGYPSLLPVSSFRIEDYIVPDPTDLTARFAMLKRKIHALSAPVLTTAQRARLEAAVKRTAATQG